MAGSGHRILLGLLFSLLIAPNLHAQFQEWIGAGSNPTLYTDPSNWDPAGYPQGSEAGIFYDVTATGLTAPVNVTAEQLEVHENSTVSFVSASGMSFNGSADSIGISGSSLYLRTNSAADSTIFSGYQVVLGDDPAEQAMASLILDAGNGGTVSLSAPGGITVGLYAPGTLGVENGATLSASNLSIAQRAITGSTSLAVVTGRNAAVTVSAATYIGYNGAAELNLENGGVLTTQEAYVGYQTGSSGTVSVSGTGSQFNATDNLIVGDGGAAMVSVSGGGGVSVTSILAIGTVNANGTVNVDGAGSALNASQSNIGSAGSVGGVLNLTNGAQATLGYLMLYPTGQINLTASTLTIGQITSGNTGSIAFNSGTINLTNQNIIVGQTALLPTISNITTGRNVNVTRTLEIPAFSELILSGGGFTAGALSIDANGLLSVTDNRTITSGAVSSDGLVAGPAGTSRLTLTGSVQGSGSYTGNTEFEGAYTPGNGTSPVAVSLGDAVFGGSNTLNLTVGFFGGTESDQLSFATLGAFGGTLDLSLAAGYTPHAGDSFELFAGPTTGNFSTLDFPNISSFGLVYDTSQLDSTGVVSLAVPEPGSALLLAFGLAGLTVLRQRKRRVR